MLVRRQLLDPNSRDPVTLHLDHSVSTSLIFQLLTYPRNLPHTVQQKARQRLKSGVGWNLYAVLGLQITDLRRPIHLYFRRHTLNTALYGTPAEHRRRITDMLEEGDTNR